MSDTPEKAERVGFIAEMMADGKWVTGVTFRQLAGLWSLHPDTVKKDAAEASRSFEVDDEEKASRKARWLAKLENAQANARKLKRCEAEAKFLELEGKASGFFEAEKIEISGNLGDLLTLGIGTSSEEPDSSVAERSGSVREGSAEGEAGS